MFTEGNTNVKTSFVASHINCRKYESRTGLTFEGCFKFNGGFKELRGIHLILDKPVLVLDSRRKLVEGIWKIEDLKDLIKIN